MLKNYFKIAWRYLAKNKVTSLINVLGLTLGFFCFILLSLFVIDELSFDNFHSDGDRIYRVVQGITEQDGDSRRVATIAPKVGTEAVAQFPEITEQMQMVEIGRLTVGNDPLNRDYERIWIADENFFRFFDFEVLHGDPQTALSRPDNLVITESIARKYFGETNVVGRSLYTNVYEATVSAVIKDFPANSHIDIQTIHAEPTWAREISSWNEWVTSNWTSNSFVTYVKTVENFDKKALEEKLSSLVNSRYDDDVTYSSTFELQPLKEIHLYSEGIEGGMNENRGNLLYVYTFAIVAVLILLIACFNYMNLSTAAASRRTREVGMRKSLGASKGQLILQYMGESIILSLLSLVFAVMLIEVSLPYINSFVGKELVLPFGEPALVVTLFAIVLTAGIASALYPSFFLSRLNPVRALKKEVKIGGRNFSLRKVLVIAQFAVSIIMISATVIIYQQLSYMQNKDLGFKLDNLLVIDINSGALRGQFEAIKQEFGKLSEVQSVTVSSRVPGEWKVFPYANVEKPGAEQASRMIFVGADEDFLETYDIELVAGRNLRNDPADSNSVLITEMAAKELGLANPVGEILRINGTIWAGDLDEDDGYSPRVVGVVEDFHFQSFREEMKPMMLASYRNPIHNIDYYTLRVNTSDWQQTLASLQEINSRFDSENPVEHTFLDNRFEQFYRADRIRGELFLVFSGIVIFIACMGLFAMASFAIENRIKEIGVRKVLGATVRDITWLLFGDSVRLVGIAFLVSVPIAWWAASGWLQEFAYRITIPWWAFVLAGMSVLVIALGTISYQTIRAALMNPVKSLRSE